MRAPTCRSHGLAHVLDWAVERGARRDALLARIALDAELLADGEARVPLAAYYAGIEAAVDELRDPLLGLRYIESVDPSALGALGFLALASPTAGDALARIFRYHAWLVEGDVFALEVVGGEARFRYVPFGPPRPAHAQCAEMYAADCFLGLARATGAPIPARSLRLAHARHGPLAEYERLRGARVRADAQRVELRRRGARAPDARRRPRARALPRGAGRRPRARLRRRGFARRAHPPRARRRAARGALRRRRSPQRCARARAACSGSSRPRARRSPRSRPSCAARAPRPTSRWACRSPR